ncbi:hypothetical protein [Borrelia coriaceae]|nr:hypothetical protein [Borrelia coriaceae]
MINPLVIINLVIILNGCSVDKKGNVGTQFYENNLDMLLYDNDSDHNNFQDDQDIWQHSQDGKKQIEKSNIGQTDANNKAKEIIQKEILHDHIDDQRIASADILEVEKLDGYLLRDNILFSVQSDISYVSEQIVFNEAFKSNDILSKIMFEKELLETYKQKLKNTLNEEQKKALEFLERALVNKVDKLNEVLGLDEDEIKNMLDIISKNLDSIRELESVNELILDFDNFDSEELVLKMSNEVRVEYTEVKNDLSEKIEPSLDDYSSVIDAHFNDDDIKSSVNNINSIEILSP